MKIDGGPMGNHTRFINHSCRENCGAKILTANEITIVAIKDINQGEELFLNYGEDYFRDMTCLCGEDICLENERKYHQKKQKKKSRKANSVFELPNSKQRGNCFEKLDNIV